MARCRWHSVSFFMICKEVYEAGQLTISYCDFNTECHSLHFGGPSRHVNAPLLKPKDPGFDPQGSELLPSFVKQSKPSAFCFSSRPSS